MVSSPYEGAERRQEEGVPGGVSERVGVAAGGLRAGRRGPGGYTELAGETGEEPWAVAGRRGPTRKSTGEVAPHFWCTPRPSGGTALAPQRLRLAAWNCALRSKGLGPALAGPAPAPGAQPASQPDGVPAGPGDSLLFPGTGHECDPPQGRGRGTAGKAGPGEGLFSSGGATVGS